MSGLVISLWGLMAILCVLRGGYIKSTQPLSEESFHSYFSWMLAGVFFALTLIPASFAICTIFNLK